MAVREVLAGARSLVLGGDCIAALEIPAEPGRFVVVVNDDYPCSTPVDWYGHGLTTLAVELDTGQLRKVHRHRLNNRVTARTPIRLTGPAAGSAPVRTSRDVDGLVVLGTMGHRLGVVTPWGTVLCRESEPELYFDRWAEVDDRFDAAVEPKEPNRFGWVVELDPHNPEAEPCKRTALGRLTGAVVDIEVLPDNRVTVRMTDRYLYRFVSHEQVARGRRLKSLLDHGVLAVAGSAGEWISLADGETSHVRGMSASEVCVFAHDAAEAMGAAKVDIR